MLDPAAGCRIESGHTALTQQAPGVLQGGLVDLLLCSQLSGHIPRPPKGGAAAEAGEGGFYSIFTDPRKVGAHSCAWVYVSDDCLTHIDH